MGGLGWWGGVKHLVGLWGPGGLTGLAGLSVDSSERRSALVEVSVLPFRCRSTSEEMNASSYGAEECSKNNSWLRFTNLPLAFDE